ncbi:MAG TPA: DUF4190 domain-containing protein [Candidatus Nanoarchaeia archaeon]|nr:DUF4190 domain-containing protein [Candidatus Nanoarchaeia archaeon]
MTKNSPFAKKSFYLGLFFWVPLFNLILSPIAIYLGIRALRQIKKEPEVYSGKGYAVVGLILGIIPLLLGLIYLIFFFFPGLKEFLLSL